MKPRKLYPQLMNFKKVPVFEIPYSSTDLCEILPIMNRRGTNQRPFQLNIFLVVEIQNWYTLLIIEIGLCFKFKKFDSLCSIKGNLWMIATTGGWVDRHQRFVLLAFRNTKEFLAKTFIDLFTFFPRIIVQVQLVWILSSKEVNLIKQSTRQESVWVE